MGYRYYNYNSTRIVIVINPKFNINYNLKKKNMKQIAIKIKY